MADPVTMAVASARIISSLVGGMGATSAAAAQAGRDENMARAASAQADGREEQLRRQARQSLGEQVAGIAQSGIGFTQTARDLMDQSAAETSLDALNARADGAVKRTGLLDDAAQQRAKARTGAITSGLHGGVAALLMTAPYLSTKSRSSGPGG